MKFYETAALVALAFGSLSTFLDRPGWPLLWIGHAVVYAILGLGDAKGGGK